MRNSRVTLFFSVALATLMTLVFLPTLFVQNAPSPVMWRFIALATGMTPIFMFGKGAMNLDVSKVARRIWKVEIVVGTILSHILAAFIVGSTALAMMPRVSQS